MGAISLIIRAHRKVIRIKNQIEAKNTNCSCCYCIKGLSSININTFLREVQPDSALDLLWDSFSSCKEI